MVVVAADKHAGHGERLHDVCSSRSTPPAEDVCLALLGVIALDDAHAAKRFGEAASDLGIDFAALAKDGPDCLEAVLQKKDEDARCTAKTVSVTVTLWWSR